MYRVCGHFVLQYELLGRGMLVSSSLAMSCQSNGPFAADWHNTFDFKIIVCVYNYNQQ